MYRSNIEDTYVGFEPAHDLQTISDNTERINETDVNSLELSELSELSELQLAVRDRPLVIYYISCRSAVRCKDRNF